MSRDIPIRDGNTSIKITTFKTFCGINRLEYRLLFEIMEYCPERWSDFRLRTW